MNEQTSPYDEIVVRIVPVRYRITQQQSSGAQEGSSEVAKRSYNALIYTKLNLPKIEPQTMPPPGQPKTVAGLPFVGKEHFTVRWNRYQEYLAAFVEGEKAPTYMRERMLEAIPDGLEELFSDPPRGERPVRLWFYCETPELDDLPWELTANRVFDDGDEWFFFVRGLPPETPVPIIPLEGQLRLAFIHRPQFTPPSLLNALTTLPPGIEVVPLTGPPHKALEEVAREGYELVHIVADGIVSLAYEGILYFHGYDLAGDSGPMESQQREHKRQISPGELNASLRGCRASVLCLTEQDYSSPDSMEIAGQLVPSVYRAFASLGSSRLSLPSVVAPLGPLKEGHLENFWRDFYTKLAETLSLVRAFSSAQTKSIRLPVALFLRHPHEFLFRRASGGSPLPDIEPNRVGAALQFSHELVEQLKAHSELYGSLPDSVSEFISSEEKRQEGLSEQLAPWLKPEEEETP